MVDPPTYRVDPDPEFADRLERVLLQRLTEDADGMSPSREVLQSGEPGRPDADLDHREADVIMLGRQDRTTGPVAPGRRRPDRWLLVAAAVAVVAVVGTVLAMSGDEEQPLHTVTPPTAARPDRDCPFTAQQVSDIIGETVAGPESSTACSFRPGDGGVFPGVYFEYLPSSACTPESRSEADGDTHSDAVDGLGVDAYSHGVSLGTSLLVCNGDRPFSVLVDGTHRDALAAAVALARLVLDG